MRPIRVEGATRVLAETQDEYYALAIVDAVVDGKPQMTSAWEPSPREIQAIISGASIHVCIAGSVHPPIKISIGPMPAPAAKGEGE